jgi:Flp pilus assembly protein TadD
MLRLPAFVPIMISLLLGSVECRAQSATVETLSPPILPANTPVILHLKESLYKRDAKPGQPVEFEVSFDVVANGQIYIQSGVPVTGSVRRIDHVGKGPAKVLIDLGPAQTISGETVRLAPTRTTAASDQPGVADAVLMSGETGPLFPVVMPVFVVMSLFEKKVLLDTNAGCYGWFGGLGGGCGVWVVARVAENVALDPAKLKAEQTTSSEVLKGGVVFLRLLLMPNPQANRQFRSLVFTGNHLHRAGDLDGAIGEYQQALAISADSWDVHFSLAQVFEEKRDFVHALPEYQRAVQLYPGYEYGRERFASLLVDSGDPDTALAEIKEAMRMWLNNIFFHYLSGKALVKKNDPDGAIAELQWALHQWENHSWQASCALGSAYELKGDLKAALGQYRTAHRVLSRPYARTLHMDDEQCRTAYERLHSQLKK